MKIETKSVKSVKSKGLRSLLRRGAIRDDGEAVKKREEKMPFALFYAGYMHIQARLCLHMRETQEGKKICPCEVFGQAFLKLDAWFESTKGRNAKKREGKAVSNE